MLVATPDVASNVWALLFNAVRSTVKPVARTLFLVIVFPSALAACCLRLEAWRLDLNWISILDTPFIVNFIRDDIPSPLFNIRFSAGHMLHS